MSLFPLQWATLRMERGAKEKNHQLYKPYTNGKTGPPGAPLTSTPPLLPAAGREYALGISDALLPADHLMRLFSCRNHCKRPHVTRGGDQRNPPEREQ